MSLLNKHTTSRDVEDFLRVWVTLPTYTYLDPLTMTFRTTSLRLLLHTSCAHQLSAVFPQAMRVHCPSENSARTVFVPCCTSCRTVVHVRRREIVPSRAQVADNLCRAAAALPHPTLRLLHGYSAAQPSTAEVGVHESAVWLRWPIDVLQKLNYTALRKNCFCFSSTMRNNLPRTLALSIEVVFSNLPSFPYRSRRTSESK